MWEILLDTLIDNLKVLPFLFLTYLLIEFLEKKAEDGSIRVINGSGKWGPVLGAALGVVPQCGFSAATANLYACGVITRGTLLAVFLSTSDEMLPILLSQNVGLGTIGKILLVKVIVALLAGFTVDAVLRRKQSEHIHEICEQEGCRCEDGVFKSALRHTLKIFVFLVVISLALNAAVELLGQERLAGFILNKPVIGELLSGLIGLIPNCAASVVITQLYLEGGMSAGAMLSGLLVGSGMGILVLVRMNRSWRDNLLTVALLYAFGVVGGALAGLLPIF
jgi:hypothetical protein